MDFKPSLDDIRGVRAQYLLQGNGREEFEELRSRIHSVIERERKGERERERVFYLFSAHNHLKYGEKRNENFVKTRRFHAANVSNGLLFFSGGRTIPNDGDVVVLVLLVICSHVSEALATLSASFSSSQTK
jgi:hypothetical protein